MPDHSTHFDDCGCLTARYEARLAAYRKVVDVAKHVAYATTEAFASQELRNALAALPKEDSK